MAEKDARIKKLEKYIPLKETEVGSKFPSRSTKSVAAMDAADLAEGKNLGKANKDAVDAMFNSRDLYHKEDFDPVKKAVVDAKLDKASELADQFRRETRGVKDTSMRGKVRELTGMKKGGKVKDSKPAVKGWGIARGARKAKMY